MGFRDLSIEQKREYHRKWYSANKNKVKSRRVTNKDYHVAYYAENKDRHNAKNKINYITNKSRYNEKDKTRTANLTDGYMTKHLLKLGYGKEHIIEYPDLKEAYKQIILTKRLIKQNNEKRITTQK